MLSNTAIPIYYGRFREKVLRGEIPVNREISMEMNRIDALIDNPGVYYDDEAINGFVKFCENELTLTDGDPLELLDTFKLWAEQIFGWYYFVEKTVYDRDKNGKLHKKVIREKKRLINKQYLIIARSAAKSLYATCLQSYFLVCDPQTTQQITTAPTMKMAEEVLTPLVTAISRHRGPVFKLMTQGNAKLLNGPQAKKELLASTKKGVENFISNSL